MKRVKREVVTSNSFYPKYLKLIRTKFGFKTHSNIDNYIKYFRTKGILVKNSSTGLLEMNKVVSVPNGEEEIELVFQFKIDNGSNEKGH